MRRIIALRESCCSALVAIAAPQALAAEGAEGQRHARPAACLQRFPWSPRADDAGDDPGRLLCPNATSTAWTPRTVPAGGVEYLATHLKGLRTANTNTITVGAGDLIGASPLISASSTTSRRSTRSTHSASTSPASATTSSTRASTSSYRMQFGGCHADDHCRTSSRSPARSSSTSRRTSYETGRTRRSSRPTRSGRSTTRRSRSSA